MMYKVENNQKRHSASIVYLYIDERICHMSTHVNMKTCSHHIPIPRCAHYIHSHAKSKEENIKQNYIILTSFIYLIFKYLMYDIYILTYRYLIHNVNIYLLDKLFTYIICSYTFSLKYHL